MTAQNHDLIVSVSSPGGYVPTILTPQLGQKA